MKPSDLSDLKKRVQGFVAEREWEQFHDAKNLSMAIATEAAELMELFRWISSEEMQSSEWRVPDQAEEELADILIFCLSFANRYDIDIYRCVTEKIKKNALKYPVGQYQGVYE